MSAMSTYQGIKGRADATLLAVEREAQRRADEIEQADLNRRARADQATADRADAWRLAEYNQTAQDRRNAQDINARDYATIANIGEMPAGVTLNPLAPTYQEDKAAAMKPYAVPGKAPAGPLSLYAGMATAPEVKQWTPKTYQQVDDERMARNIANTATKYADASISEIGSRPTYYAANPDALRLKFDNINSMLTANGQPALSWDEFRVKIPADVQAKIGLTQAQTAESGARTNKIEKETEYIPKNYDLKRQQAEDSVRINEARLALQKQGILLTNARGEATLDERARHNLVMEDIAKSKAGAKKDTLTKTTQELAMGVGFEPAALTMFPASVMRTLTDPDNNLWEADPNNSDRRILTAAGRQRIKTINNNARKSLDAKGGPQSQRRAMIIAKAKQMGWDKATTDAYLKSKGL